eukprot:GHRQ01034836.1.p1 GENE.GHRQ01034836.1~~GHRQ01034836.1.p1  ORF type:complete len:142 (-),score=11.82 GHRQ01034836.1:92-517(-)
MLRKSNMLRLLKMRRAIWVVYLTWSDLGTQLYPPSKSAHREQGPAVPTAPPNHPAPPPLTAQALPHQGVTLMKARWPSHAGAVDAAALAQFDQLKELVRGVRNARTEYGLEQARKVRPAAGCQWTSALVLERRAHSALDSP